MDTHGKKNEQKEMSDKQDVEFAICCFSSSVVL